MASSSTATDIHTRPPVTPTASGHPDRLTSAQLRQRGDLLKAAMWKTKVFTPERVALEKATNANYAAAEHMATAEARIREAGQVLGRTSGLHAAELRTQAKQLRDRMWKTKVLTPERKRLEQAANAHQRAADLVAQADTHAAAADRILAAAPKTPEIAAATQTGVSAMHKRPPTKKADAAPAPADTGSSAMSYALPVAGGLALLGIGWALTRPAQATS